MLGRLFLLFLVVPIIDLALLVAVGDRLGFVPTLALVVATAAAGSYLARREGTAAWRRVQSKLASGAVPGPEVIDGLLVLMAGVLLVSPGFLTDVAGLLGLLPPTRAVAQRWLTRRWARGVASGRVQTVSLGRAAAPVEDAEIIDEGPPDAHSVARARL